MYMGKMQRKVPQPPRRYSRKLVNSLSLLTVFSMVFYVIMSIINLLALRLTTPVLQRHPELRHHAAVAAIPSGEAISVLQQHRERQHQAAVAATPSGEAMPVGDIPGWHQIFTDAFTKTMPIGSFPGAVASKWL